MCCLCLHLIVETIYYSASFFLLVRVSSGFSSHGGYGPGWYWLGLYRADQVLAISDFEQSPSDGFDELEAEVWCVSRECLNDTWF